jgi:RNA polymerase sigma-70 factor (ECF subfamily)
VAVNSVVEREAFAEQAATFRRELLAHCYRMLGSVDDAEDVVQETYLRAWRGYGQFEGRSTLRAWLYRIATNACLSALQRGGRRVLASSLGPPAEDPTIAPVATGSEVRWLQPVPDALVAPESEDPAMIVASRESLRLALIATLQYLPARQRAVLLLREVVAMPATDVAATLDMSVPAVKSALQRARARLASVSTEVTAVDEPTEPEARALLDQYIFAFEHSDPTALERALHRDIVLEMTGTRTWFAGLRTCMPFFKSTALGNAGDWRMVPTRANAQPAAVAFYRGGGYGVAVLTLKRGGISRISVFGDPSLVTRFASPRQ